MYRVKKEISIYVDVHHFTLTPARAHLKYSRIGIVIASTVLPR